MNEQKKSRELFLYYTPVYNILIQNWFLDPTEKLLAAIFASSPNGECTLSREVLKKHCRCGHYHLERAIKRLEFMKIISIDLGGWKQRNPPLRESNRNQNLKAVIDEVVLPFHMGFQLVRLRHSS